MLLTILPCTGQRHVSVGLRLRKPAPDCKPRGESPSTFFSACPSASAQRGLASLKNERTNSSQCPLCSPVPKAGPSVLPEGEATPPRSFRQEAAEA